VTLLAQAPASELQAFLTRWAGTYQEDRLRNDWLQQLGKRRDWATFTAEYPRFRMRDDREVRCYALATEAMNSKADVAEEALRLVNEQYHGGTATVTRYLEAETDRASASLRSIIARFEAQVAQAQLMQAVGHWR
jgi:hypothetical protein